MKVQDYLNEENKSKKNYLSCLIKRTLLSACLVLIVLIMCNTFPKFKDTLNKNVINKNYNFAKINSIYQKYLLKIKKDTDKVTQMVNKENTLEYTKETKYLNGVNLNVGLNYPVKALDSGLVVFIGERELTGKTIIIEQSNGIDVIYGNVQTSDIKIYDYVEKDTIIGETLYEDLYLEFQKDGESINYKPYIKF